MAVETRIRCAYPAEKQLLEALQWRASLNNPGDREALLAFPDAIQLPLKQIEDGDVFVAERDGILAGFAAILLRDDGDQELDALFVEPQFWRTGIGRLLVEHCASTSWHQGAALLHVVGNPHAEGFYKACGFVVRSRKQMGFGMGLLMERPLRSP